MTLPPIVVLVGFAVLPVSEAAMADPASVPSVMSPGARVRLAQDAGGATTPAPGSALPNSGLGPTLPGSGSTAPGSAAPSAPSPAGSTGAAAGTAPPPATSAAVPPQVPAPTGATRNGNAALPTLLQPNPGSQSSSGTSITYGGPQVDVQPIYGSPLRDTGAGSGGAPIYNSAPGTPGGPISGTANAYYPTLPNGSAAPGQGTSAGRGNQNGANATSYTRQPLGGVPFTRDQTGTYGGRAGYDAQGVYNGTAVQGGNGYGYGSPYATSGRPTGGLLSTNVDATGPLRPYIPLNTGPSGRPNSGYGIPNGSRSTHMDSRGIQRVD